MKSNRQTSASVFRTGIISGGLLALLAPGSVLAACAQWDVSGPLDLVQTNGTTVTANLHQTDTGIQGDARYEVERSDGWLQGNNYYDVGGSVDGTIKGEELDITIYWTNQTTGVYAGRVNPQGRVTGSTYDALHPQTMANWHSDRTLKCVPAAAPAAPAGPPKPVLALGRVQPAPGTPASEPMTICDRARSARARNSPVAPELERQCIAAAK
jgi:hypothetical protein